MSSNAEVCCPDLWDRINELEAQLTEAQNINRIAALHCEELEALYNHELACGKTMRAYSRSLLTTVERMKGALEECLKSIEDISWGWDGDCGAESKIEWIVSNALNPPTKENSDG